MVKDKYTRIFSCQIEAVVFIILQIFFAIFTTSFENLGISPDAPRFSWEIFGHVTRLGQSRASENA